MHKGKVIPIEVKSGAAGRMKSLQVFLSAKQPLGGQALRFLNNLPERQVVPLEVGGEYELVNLPHYLVEYWRRWV